LVVGVDGEDRREEERRRGMRYCTFDLLIRGLIVGLFFKVTLSTVHEQNSRFVLGGSDVCNRLIAFVVG